MQLFYLIKIKKMKKTLALLIILIVVKPLYSQLKIYTNQNMSGIWNQYRKEYKYGERKTAYITFEVWDKYISADDNSRSVYRIIKKADDVYDTDYKIVGWDCYDERNRKCRWSIIRYYSQDMPDVITIIYSDIAYMYFISDFERN